VSKGDDPILMTTMFGYLQLTRGIGNIGAPLISTRLSSGNYSANIPAHRGFDVGGGRFGSMIVYGGTCFATGALIATLGLGWDLRKMMKQRSGVEN
jgi:MFS transporter, MCT family, solute carrier family 16 (monocarboxylic acid transporters), member 10